jgi:hypothetical protein
MIIFSFSILGGPAFKKKYAPMFFTEARRAKPNLLWGVFRYIQRRSNSARMNDFVEQVEKKNQWTIGGTTFDLSGLVIKEGTVVHFKNAKMGIHPGQVVFEERVPCDGLFSKTKKVVIKADTTVDSDCFLSLVRHYLSDKTEGGTESLAASEVPIPTQALGGAMSDEALYKLQSNILVEAMLELAGSGRNWTLKAMWKMWENKVFETHVCVDLSIEQAWEKTTSILLYMGRRLPELPGFAVLFEAYFVIVSASVEASDGGTRIGIRTVSKGSKSEIPKTYAEFVCECIKCYENLDII